MTEIISSARRVHQLSMGVCASLLVLAALPREPAGSEEALAELAVLASLLLGGRRCRALGRASSIAGV